MTYSRFSPIVAALLLCFCSISQFQAQCLGQVLDHILPIGQYGDDVFYDHYAGSLIRRDGIDNIGGPPGASTDECPGRLACLACSGSCSALKRKRAVQFEEVERPANETDQDEHAHDLQKRTLEPKNIGELGAYFSMLLSGRRRASKLDITPVKNGVELTGTTFALFQDYATVNPALGNRLVIGVPDSFLTGCSVLAVISARAVYMGHLWQSLAFVNYATPDDIKNGAIATPADLQRNVINLLTGNPDLYYAQGPKLDPAYFNAQDDNTVAFLMTPRYKGPEDYYFKDEIETIGQAIRNIVGTSNLKLYEVYGYYPLKNPRADQAYRAQAVFEYDGNADGNGNGNWRLWLEQNPYDGVTFASQNVVGKNRPS